MTLVAAASALVLPVSAASAATSAAERHQWLDVVASGRSAAPPAEMRIILFRGAPAAIREGATSGSAAAAAATRKQDRELAAVRAAGVHLEVQGRFVRVVDGVVARVRPADLGKLAALDSVKGVFAVRALAPTALSDTAVSALGAGARPVPATAEALGAATTVAILDGPIDPTAAYLGGRASIASGLQSGQGVGAGAEHGTALAGIVTGAGGPAGLAGVAPAASVLSIPIFAAAGDGTLTGTDADLLAGLERAADPNGDGNLADRARVALVAATAPYASFRSTPVDEATDDLARLGTVVVAAAGNDGPTGSARGSIGAPASGPSVLAVGATDGRSTLPAVGVTIDGGPNVLGGTLGLLDTVAPANGLRLPLRLPGGGDVAGAAVVVQRGTSLRAQARAAAAAGAVAVVAWGEDAGPVGALGIDDAAPLPILSLDSGTAATLVAELTGGAPLTIAFGAAADVPNPAIGTVAAFSASGLTDDGRLKPDLVAPGVAIVTSTGTGFASFTGTSVAAAQVAGLVAGLAGRHPDWSADRLRAAIVDTAAPVTGTDGALADVSVQGGGAPDLVAADSLPILATPGTLSFGTVSPGVAVTRPLGLEDVGSGAASVSLQFVPDEPAAAAGVRVTASSPQLQIVSGEAVPIQITLTATTAPAHPTALGGWLVLHLASADGSTRDVRVPVAAAMGDARQPLLRSAAIDAAPVAGTSSAATLSVDLGGVAETGVDTGDARLDVQTVRRLTVELRRPGGHSLGVVYEAADMLPGHASFSFEARRPDGSALGRGTYQLLVRARSGDGRVEVRRLPFRVH